MMKLIKTFGAAMAISLLLVTLSGCEKKMGPAEQAGKAVDDAVEKTGDQIEKAGQKIQDTARGDKK